MLPPSALRCLPTSSSITMSSTPSSATRRPAPTTSTTNPSTLDAFAASKSVPLPYSIAAVSSYSGTYEPSNILTDKPHDLSSRWSGASVAAVASSSATTSAGGVAGAAAAAAAGSSRSANVPAAAVGGGAGGAGNGKQYIILKLSQLAVASESRPRLSLLRISPAHWTPTSLISPRIHPLRQIPQGSPLQPSRLQSVRRPFCRP